MDPATNPTNWKTVEKKDIVITVSYLIGQKENILREHYEEYASLIDSLKKNDDANVLRCLCKLRTALMQNFKKTDIARRQLITIEDMEWFDADDIRFLRKKGIETVLSNKMAADHALEFNRQIDRHVDSCKKLFPEWLNFDYVRDLFVIPKYDKPNILIQEFEIYQANRNLYPFQYYIHWNPVENGNILYADEKFIKILYTQHGEEFADSSKCHDAVEETKRSIYDFINEAESVIICVDCENSDPYKLFGALSNMDKKQIAKISRIVLYDDVHTTRAWDYISSTTHIEVEHVEVNRIMNGKSLVDIRMTAGICKAHYEENIDSFILCSSDSDFWGLIETLDKAKFLVMYEYEKCSRSIRDALDKKKFFHCSLDDFFTGNAQTLQTIVLKKELEDRLPNITGRDAWMLTKELYTKTRIRATEGEMRIFYEKYMKTLRLKINSDGVYVVEMAD